MSNVINYHFNCSSCKHCIQVGCHPWNKEIGKGNMSDNLGYICMLFVKDKRPAIFMEHDLGKCECHTERD